VSDVGKPWVPEYIPGPTPKKEVRFGGRLDDRLFSRLCRENPDLRLERTSKGDLVVMTPAGAESSERNFDLCGQLYDWNKSTRLGHAFDSSAGFRLPNGAIVSPAASWIPNDRWESLTPDERLGVPIATEQKTTIFQASRSRKRS
jgi:Uma2 family endonuclease